MPISSSFQKRIVGLLYDYEISRAELADKTKCNFSTLSKACAYGILPSTKNLIRLADYFDVSLSYLLGETETSDFIKSDQPTTFRIRFNELCEENGLTHYKVSRKCYFDKSNISRWISKGYLPTIEILHPLCELFHVSMDYLLGRTDYRN